MSQRQFARKGRIIQMLSKSPAGAIAWTLHFRVGTRENAERELTRVAEVLGEPLRTLKCERYWKIPEHWVCDAETPLEAQTVPELITGCLVCANRIARGWSIHGPSLGPDGKLENLWGVFKAGSSHPSGTSLSSLAWAEFVLTSHL